MATTQRSGVWNSGLALILTFTIAVLPTVGADAQEQLAIKGGRIVPIVGEPIDDGVILIRDGTIQEVGKDLEIPIEARVIDATGKTVLPGFVEPHSPEPLVQPNEVNPNVPFVTVVDAVDPNAIYFEEARRNGVTAVHAIPGNSTMFGGKSAVVKTSGTFAEDMVLKRDAGLKLSLRPAGSSSRMSHLARLRRELDETKRYMASLEEKAQESEDEAKDDDTADEESSDDPKAPQDEDEAKDDDDSNSASNPEDAAPDAQREAMVRLLKGELPAFLYCELAMDVPHALRLIDDYKMKATLILGRDCYKAVDLLAGRDEPVILDPELVFWETDPRTDRDDQIVLPRLYREAGVPITFQTSGSSLFSATTLGPSLLWYQAAMAVKYGMPEEEALEALTLRPARLIGVDSFVGSIEPGKDADLVILTGDPLKLGTWVDTTIIDGKIVYRREDDSRMRALLFPNAEESPDQE
ncbi:amidohydrolase family protein [Tautonia marina]|uniref:amidohydrolase family protein n=1 Tax=Tautonia marina TaxID=2653855 RepID=UPI0012604D34|nr:amidohydrolase family protein [Tautonia marina]